MPHMPYGSLPLNDFYVRVFEQMEPDRLDELEKQLLEEEDEDEEHGSVVKRQTQQP